MGTKLRNRIYLVFSLAFVMMLVVPTAGFALEAAPAGATSTSAPTIQSDKEDYPPGGTVILTGGNWQPGETVNINVNDDDGQTWNRNVNVIADENGNVRDEFVLPDWFVAVYHVTATGDSGSVAKTTFTDGNLRATGGGLTGGEKWKLTWTSYRDTVTCNTLVDPGTVKEGPKEEILGIGNNSNNIAVDNGQSAKLQASATLVDNTGTKVFEKWTDHTGAFVSNNPVICVVGFQNNPGLRTYTAHYVSNRAPVANNDSATTTEDNAINSIPVLANDTDADSNSLSVSSFTQPANGTVTKNADGTLKYVPNANYNGSDTFTYKANDGKVDSNSATVSITVNAVDDNPVAVNDNKTVAEDANATTIDVRNNDTDVDGGPKTIQSVTQPQNGTVAITNSGSDLTYKPNANHCNGGSPTDNFTYTLNGGSTATVAMTVTCVNDAPSTPGTPQLAGGDSSPNQGGFTLDWTASTDVDSGSVTYELQHKQANGIYTTVQGASNLGSASYTFGGSNPVEDEGTWTYQVRASDGSLSSDFSADSSAITVDRTAPQFSCDQPDGNWHKDNVTLNCIASDGGSGLADGSPASFTLSTAVADGTETANASTGSQDLFDLAGNKATAGPYTGIKVDRKAPGYSCPAADSDWHATNQTFDCMASDGGSGLDPTSDENFPLSTSVADGDENSNASTGTKVLTDAVGNTVTAPAITGVKVDRKAPAVVPENVIDPTWRNESLSQSFTSSDGGSGLASGQSLGANGSFTLTASAESADATTPTEVSKDIKDAVGNTTTRKVSALIDLTNPNISASVLNTPASTGWYNLSTGGPQVDFDCSDVLSGIQSCPDDFTITDEGSNVGYSGTAYDVAGNSKGVSGSGLKVDLTAPAVAGAPDLLASSDSGDQDDNLTNVRMPTFDISAEAGSTVDLYAKKDGEETLLGSATTSSGGVARITSATSLDDGSYEVYGKVTDQAGNVSSTNGIQVTIVTIDATAPDAPGLDMAAASDTGVSDSDDKTNNDKPKFNGTAEAGSTLKLYDGTNLLTTITVGAGGTWSFTPANALGEGTHQIKATATDAADNTSSESQLSVVIDTIAPQVTANQPTTSPNAAGWYNDNVINDFAFSDGNGSGLANAADASFNKATQGEGTGVKVNSGPVSDVAGNTNPGVDSAGFNIDLSDPTNVAFVGGPAAGGSYDFGNVPAQPTCTAQDAVSGLKDCVVTGYSNLVGTHTMTATATDTAGRTATATRTYTVKAWTFNGFYQPIDMSTPTTTVYNTVKGGSTVPFKFELFQGTTELTATSAINQPLQAQKISCSTGATEDTIELLATGGTSLRYDTTGGQYIYNWKTPTGANTCYKVTITANDGSSKTAYFKLK